MRISDWSSDVCSSDLLGLPGKPGLEVLRDWRAGGLTTPVLILTARGSWAERIDGLKAGADDYLTKPFHPDRKSVVWGKSVSVRVDLGGRRNIKKTKAQQTQNMPIK